MYIGRFAPSPTGPLHFGSLIAAVSSYLDARCNNGDWRVRIDDLDPPREQAGAADDILATLEAFGFAWDGEVMYQSRRHAAYDAALARLRNHELVYACTCSRKEVDESGRKGAYGMIYPGTCRNSPNRKSSAASALRLCTEDKVVGFRDLIQGPYAQNLRRDIGDFVLLRRDGYYAYHLAVSVDDAAQGITHIVRGSDLLDSTPRQIYLQQLLDLPTPLYAHTPVAIDSNGDKLSKQTYAPRLRSEHAGRQLFQALLFLNQTPPQDLQHENLQTIWAWALDNWSLQKIAKTLKLPAPAGL